MTDAVLPPAPTGVTSAPVAAGPAPSPNAEPSRSPTETPAPEQGKPEVAAAKSATPAPTEAEKRIAQLMSDKPMDGDPQRVATTLYADSGPPGSNAQWNETAAHSPREIGELKAPDKARDPTVSDADAAADMDKFKAAAVAVGLGPTTTQELYSHVGEQIARGEPYEGTAEEGMRALRSVWGTKTGERVRAVQAAIAEFQQHYPGVKQYLEFSNVGNDPAFIRKIWARLASKARQ